jgi:hypothetical protein
MQPALGAIENETLRCLEGGGMGSLGHVVLSVVEDGDTLRFSDRKSTR